MKQFAFMALTLLLGTAGSFALSPVYGVAVYYMYAVLRPQFIWEWVELSGVRLGDVNWSFPVAVVTLAATLLWRVGLWTPFAAAKAPWYGNPRFGRSHYLFLAFTAWISLTYLVILFGLASDVPGFTMDQRERVARPYFIEYAKIFVMFVCASLVLRSVRDLWVIYHVVVACVAYVAYELNFYYLVYGSNTLYTRGYGGLDNNGAALMLAMAVPLCFFAWEANRRWWRWAFLAVIPVLLHAVMLSHSRGAMLSLCVAAVFVWVRARNKRFVTALYGVAVVLVLVMAGKEVRDRFFSIGRHEFDQSANSRKNTWGIAVRMAVEEPLFGYGIRNSNLFIDRYGADMQGRTIHSQYLQTAADSGLPALGLYLALLASVFAGLWQVRRAARPFADPETLKVRSLASGLECALVVFCVGAVFLSLEHFEMPYIMILLAVQLHAVTRAIAERLNPPQAGLPPLALPHPYPYPAGPPRPAVSP